MAMRVAVPILFAACLAGPAAHAADLVLFEDGRGIRVAGVAITDGVAVLTLETGGELGVPASSIMAIERAIDPADPEPVEDPARAAAAAAIVDDMRANEAWRTAAGKYAGVIAEAADRYALDRALLAAVAKTESNFNPYAISPKGACGILQLMPGTVKRFGVKNVFDVAQNVDAGARYLRFLLDRFEGKVELALAGYNAGEGAVDRHGGIPPYAETEWYVLKVLDRATHPAVQSPSR
jgi:soluble lytic murein transglycosylase-like protein